MIDLPNLTIFSMVWKDDSKWIIKVGRVLRYCLHIMRPAKAILFTHNRIATDRSYPFEVVQIPELNWQSFNIFVNRIVPTFIRSEFAMSVHEDGFPLDVSLWDPRFLEYDYIGAPWDDGMVGNGGFNIESKRLMDLKQTMPLTEEDFRTPSDRLICTTRKAYLEERGVRFAPRELALKFSTEQVGRNQPSFGFHGRGPSAEKYRQGWATINSMQLIHKGGFSLDGNKAVHVPRMMRPGVAEASAAMRNALAPIDLPAAENMKITVVYVYPLVAGEKYHNYAKRFAEHYAKFKPGLDAELVVVLNGGKISTSIMQTFAGLPVRYVQHDNSGYDLGAFQAVSRKCASDMIVFFGASTYLVKEGWLRRMAETFKAHNNAIYGAMGNKGDARYRVWPHIRTTAFWMAPKLFNAYPKIVKRPGERHAFEHGPENLTGWVTRNKLKAWVITWTGEYEWEHWDDDPNGYQRGNCSGLLAGDHLCEQPYYTPK